MPNAIHRIASLPRKTTRVSTAAAASRGRESVNGKRVGKRAECGPADAGEKTAVAQRRENASTEERLLCAGHEPFPKGRISPFAWPYTSAKPLNYIAIMQLVTGERLPNSYYNNNPLSIFIYIKSYLILLFHCPSGLLCSRRSTRASSLLQLSSRLDDAPLSFVLTPLPGADCMPHHRGSTMAST